MITQKIIFVGKDFWSCTLFIFWMGCSLSFSRSAALLWHLKKSLQIWETLNFLLSWVSLQCSSAYYTQDSSGRAVWRWCQVFQLSVGRRADRQRLLLDPLRFWLWSQSLFLHLTSRFKARVFTQRGWFKLNTLRRFAYNFFIRNLCWFMIQKFIWGKKKPFLFFFLAVKNSTRNSLIYFLTSIPNKRCWGRGKPLPRWAEPFSTWHQITRTQKRVEAKFCNFGFCADLKAAEMGPREIHCKGRACALYTLASVILFQWSCAGPLRAWHSSERSKICVPECYSLGGAVGETCKTMTRE